MRDKLPNADAAFVEATKLTEYLLSTSHKDGKGKAKFFMAFGFSLADVAVMEAALLLHPIAQPVAQIKETEHGVKYEVACSVETPDGRNPCIRSVWIVDAGKSEPRLVTAFPN